MVDPLQRIKGQRAAASGLTHQQVKLAEIIPGFVIGFIVMALVRTAGVTLGVLPQNIALPGQLHSAAQALLMFDSISRFMILMALSAVGLNTQFSVLK